MKDRCVIRTLLLTTSNTNRCCGHRPGLMFVLGNADQGEGAGTGVDSVCPEVMRSSTVLGQVIYDGDTRKSLNSPRPGNL